MPVRVRDEQRRKSEKSQRRRRKLKLNNKRDAVADIHQQRVESSTARGIAARRTTSPSAWRQRKGRPEEEKPTKRGREGAEGERPGVEEKRERKIE